MRIPRNVSEAVSLAESLVQLWHARDERMDADQWLYELRAPLVEGRQVGLTLNDGRVAVDKVAGMLAGAEPLYACASGTDEDEDAVQRIEDLVYYADYELGRRFALTGRPDLRYWVAHMLALRGQVASLVLLDPARPTFPWQEILLDAREVYPQLGVGEPEVVVHKAWQTKASLSAHPFWGRAARGKFGELKGEARGERVVVWGFYTPTECAVACEGVWLKAPVAHGYAQNPLQLYFGPGAGYEYTELTARWDRVDRSGRAMQGGTGDWRDDWTRQRGTGVLTPIWEAIRDKRELLLMLRTVLEAAANPATFHRRRGLGTADAEPIDLASGARNEGEPEDSVDLLYVDRAIQDAAPLLQAIQDQINRYLPPILFGEGNPVTSGFDRAILTNSAKHTLLPFVKADQAYHEGRARALLALFARFGAAPVPVLGIDSESGRRTALYRIQPLEVWGADLRLTCKLTDPTPLDRMQRAEEAAVLAREGLVDRVTLRGDEFLGLRNPRKVSQRVLLEQFDQIPELVRLRTLYAKSLDVNDPHGAAVAGMLYAKEFAQFSVLMAQPPQPPQQAPPPGLGMANEVLPDELGINAGAAPNGSVLGPEAGGVPAPAGVF